MPAYTVTYRYVLSTEMHTPVMYIPTEYTTVIAENEANAWEIFLKTNLRPQSIGYFTKIKIEENNNPNLAL